MSTFKELGVSAVFIKALKELNINQPTEIQEQAIQILLKDATDFVGQAQTGTGKTVAFGIPLLEKIKPSEKVIQAIILCPTRELSIQISKQLFKFTKFSDKIFTEAIYGGERIELQIAKLRRPTHIVVATPGRLLDLIRRKEIDVRKVKNIVLDEADEMLKMGFKEDIDQILKIIKTSYNTWLFSATLSKDVNQIIDNHIDKNAVRIAIDPGSVVNRSIIHEYIICEDKQKFTSLLKFLRDQQELRGIIFCKTKNSAKLLHSQLLTHKLAVDVIHGDLLQIERDKVMRAFKKETVKLLIATDVSARGIDIQGLEFVIHYELPDIVDYYTHRSGRTARAGKKGFALSFVTAKELKKLKKIEAELNLVMNQIS